MLSILKKWFWYDWVVLAIRTTWLAIIVISGFINPSLIITPLWIVGMLTLLVYVIPPIVQYRKRNWYLAVEVIFA